MPRIQLTSILWILVFLHVTASFTSHVANAAAAFEPLDDLRGGAVHSIDLDNLLLVGMGSVTTISARNFDPMIRDYFGASNRMNGYDALGNDVLGHGYPGIGIGIFLWSFGEIGNFAHESRAGQATLEAMLTTAILVEGLKYSTHRLRPDESEYVSFPSGHVSTVAATSGVLAEFYGWPAAIPGAAVTTYVAICRMNASKHWLTDTMAAAVLGWWVGRSFAKHHIEKFERLSRASSEKKSEPAPPKKDEALQVSLLPIATEDAVGVAGLVRF